MAVHLNRRVRASSQIHIQFRRVTIVLKFIKHWEEVFIGCWHPVGILNSLRRHDSLVIVGKLVFVHVVGVCSSVVERGCLSNMIRLRLTILHLIILPHELSILLLHLICLLLLLALPFKPHNARIIHNHHIGLLELRICNRNISIKVVPHIMIANYITLVVSY